MTTKLVVPPMPEPDDFLTYPAEVPLKTWGSNGWQTAQREAALADELAGALDNLVYLSELAMREANADCSQFDIKYELAPAYALLAKHTAARQMNKEAQ